MNLMDNLYIKRICPSCLNEFYPGDCDIVSRTTIDPMTKTNKVLKPAPQGAWQQRKARVYPEQIKGKYVLELACRKCPHCGYLLPANIELAENLNIAIVGDTFSGKTHYIATLINQMKKGDLQRADRFAALDSLTPEVENIYIRDVINRLIEDKRSPDSTQPAELDQPNREPLIYELILAPSPEHAPRRVNIILYDVSGEDIAIKERMVTVGRYVLSANAIIFIADPNSMPEIYEELPDFLRRKTATGRTNAAILNSVINLIKTYRGLDAVSRLASMPIAITLSKSDLLRNVVDLQNEPKFLKRPIYNGSFDLKDMDNVDEEVRRLLENFGERMLLQSTQNFSKVKFFAVSATGYSPDKNQKYPRIDPCRCLDPFLWALYELGVLRPNR